jgi:bifunctional DNA-binding transcriptional regulator/antitoxin component of YhaV-PrlF toxin-antitoxin module
MAKVTSKLQVTPPKTMAERHGIAPGDRIDFESAGDVIRVVPSRRSSPRDVGQCLRLSDRATARQRAHDRARPAAAANDRGWSRDRLYARGRAR